MLITEKITLDPSQLEVMPTGWNGEKSYWGDGKAYIGDQPIDFSFEYYEKREVIKATRYTPESIHYTDQQLIIDNIRLEDEDCNEIIIDDDMRLAIEKEITKKIDIQ